MEYIMLRGIKLCDLEPSLLSASLSNNYYLTLKNTYLGHGIPVYSMLYKYSKTCLSNTLTFSKNSAIKGRVSLKADLFPSTIITQEKCCKRNNAFKISSTAHNFCKIFYYLR